MGVHDDAVALARSIFELRKRRARHLPDPALSEMSWNILLALFVANADGQKCLIKDAIIVAEVSPAVGKRWITVLQTEGLLMCGNPNCDHVEDMVELTPRGVAAVEACMVDAQKFLQSRMILKAA